MRVFSVGEVRGECWCVYGKMSRNDNINYDMGSLSLRRCHLRKSGDFFEARGVGTFDQTISLA
jgi:hypothetical protein